jgi:glutamate racemase
VGTVEPAVRSALAATRRGRIGVIGTDATVNSGAYEHAIHRARPDVEVFSRSCPLFVPLVEQGMFDGEIVDKVIELYLKPLREARVDTLVLGCTHYPLLLDAIQRFMGDGVTVVECSKAIAQDVDTLLSGGKVERAPAYSPASRRDHYFVTDEVGRFNYLANLFLGSSNVEAIKIETLE